MVTQLEHSNNAVYFQQLFVARQTRLCIIRMLELSHHDDGSGIVIHNPHCQFQPWPKHHSLPGQLLQLLPTPIVFPFALAGLVVMLVLQSC